MENLVRSKKFEYFALFCLLGYAAFKISYRPLNDVFQTLFILCFALSAFYDRDFLKKDPMVKLFGIALIVQLAAWINGTYFTPYTPRLSLNGLPQLFFFIPIAYFLKGKPRYIIYTLIAFCLGGILVLFTRNGSDAFHLLELGLLKNRRINLLFNNSNHPGLLGGTLLLTSIALLTISWMLIKNNVQKIKIAFIVLISLITLFFGVSYVYISQARTTYLALFVTLVFTPLIYHLLQLNAKKLLMRALPITAIMVLLSVWVVNVPNIHKRLFTEQHVWQQLFEGNIESIQKSSIGFRIRFWRGAKDQIEHYPLLGLGDTKAAGYSQDQSKYISKREKKHFRFMHNGHIELLLAFGLLGLSVIWGTYVYLVKSSYRASTNHQWLLTTSAIALTLYLFATNGFESYYIYKQGIFIHNLLIGCIYSIAMYMNSRKLTQ